MKVKCRGCGNLVERNFAFRTIVNGKNAYWCNEQEYRKIEEEKNNSAKVIELIESIFGCKILNTLLKKEKKEWNMITDDRTLVSYLTENYHRLENTMSRQFQSEYNKIRYFSAIIKNSIADYIVPQEIVKNDLSDMEFYAPKKTPYRPRTGFAEIEREDDERNDLD